ncbi:DUF4280 domain-containing protein [Chryseobacterium sp. RP-3-3]|uniref:DUF4280 domain-containing protein n=1 Tax=Chryseobacterium antibioticum TaxID=2728847 RepID=A0A7Y0AN80_9FLAO|nr:PAAR-like protein [Chryseobacterium antibioticum]NML70325.1 DUF4280 domain-containing protein [Chryseobacterium antibioticum]
MSAPIPYTVQSGETLQDIAKKLGIKDWTKLKQYHNEQAGSGQQTSDIPYAGFILQTPPKDEIYTMNGETPPPDPVEEQKSAEQKQDQEKKKEEEEKKEEKASKSDHDGKYFVVHNAKCVCDKAENPKQTADLQVTTHSIIVLNDEQGKLAATEEDKTFIPPAATFGKCKLKPSSGGYLPCALAPAPKWAKTYESTQVMGKNTLTEISELQCTVGGKITIFKHGQTDSVSNAHADNTNPVELAMVNPAIDQPKKKEEYPSVTSIVLTKVENRTAFKEIDSKNKSSIIYLRKDQEASFKANLKSGNKQLTSWMVYSDHQGKKENRIFLREQIGTEFSQSFEGLGKFRIEGYGKPKNQDFEKGKYDKCDPSCSIDVEVVENTLIDIECTSADFTTRIDPSKNRKFRKGVPSVFKAKFFIPDLTAEEKSKLTLSVQDGSGNTITEGVQENGEILTFTPKNTKAKYTIIARYTNDQGEVIEKQIAGETEGNAVLSISHGAEVVRPGTAMSFSVSKMKYKFGADNSPYDLTSEESSEIKWNLNGIPQGTGKSFTIAGSKLMAPGKYIVEAYSISANATGKNAKKEDDDWHFEVKENDVVSFTLSGTPKVGKPITATVDKMVFADLLPNEIVHWQGFSTPVTGKSITFTPKTPGTLSITSKIKGKGVTQKVNVVQPVINDIQFTDSNGNKIEKASWGHKVNIWIDQNGLSNEEINVVLWDNDTVQDDPVKTITINPYDGGLIPVTLDSYMKDKAGNQGLIYAKVSVPKLIATGEGQSFPKTYKLDVQDKREIYNAIFGSANGKEKHTIVDYDEISYLYAHSRGISASENLYLEIRDSVFGKDPLLLFQTNIKADQSGVIKQRIVWNNIKNKVNSLTVYAIIKENNKEGKVLYDADGDFSMATAKLKKGSSLTKLAENNGAVKVGDEKIVKNTGTCVCRDYDLIWGGHPNVNCEFRKKVVEICKDLWGEENKIQMANNLMAVFRWESGGTFKPDAPNQADSGGTGLIQFMPSTAAGLLGKKITIENVKNYYGKKYNKKTKQKEDWYLKRVKEFADMTAIQQLDYVKKYFEPLRNKTVEFVDFYLQVLFPASSRKDDHIVFASSLDKLTTRTNEPEKLRNLRVTAYKQNDGLDTNKDGKIWKSEIKAKVQVYITEGTANKESNFECGENNDKNNPAEISLCSKDGSQCLDYADVWENPIISSDNGGKNNNRFDKGSSRGHKGVDILSGPIYKEVHSLMCGKVEKIITSFKTNQYGEKKLGNVINIKSKDKNGNIVYILYCHLDKVYVEEGETVKHGQKIALSGSTGNASDGSLPNGIPGRGINKENWHVHIEACSNGSGAATFFGKDRLQPEDYMKTKFDNKGNAIK